MHKNENSVLKTAMFCSGKYLKADIPKECCTGPERGGRIQMYGSRELSGVSIKAAGILERRS